MQFGLSESQQILKDTARKFFAGESPIAAVRKAMETDTAYDAALWTKLAEQGFTGIIAPEEFGGMGLGKVELILLMEEAGYALLPGPFFSTVALAGSVIEACGSPEQKKKVPGQHRFRTGAFYGRAGGSRRKLGYRKSWNQRRRQQAYGNKTFCERRRRS
jgi:alkylation response protein AidB-like acyl-CoA dehydrogenase